MKPKTWWRLAVILLIAHLAIQYVFYLNIDFSDVIGQLTFVADLLSNLFLIALWGLGVGALLALAPFRQKTFREKFKAIVPIAIVILLVVLVTAYGYSVASKTNRSEKSKWQVSSLSWQEICA